MLFRSVTVPADEFEQSIDAAYRRFAQQVRIPGFRPGKAPRRILEQSIPVAEARAQALKDSLPDYYVEAVGTELANESLTVTSKIAGIVNQTMCRRI